MSSPQNKQPVSRAFSNNGTNFEDLTVNYTGMPCSPKGSSKGPEKMVSPGRVRTMKEYEEQMAELKKENFNLKLRIYFIEERQEQMKGLKDVDALFKKNVELNCELETLKKDLSEKEELLLQSAKAMEILQSQHKKQLEELKQACTRDKAYLEEHINNLQMVLKEKEQTINQFDDSSAMYALAFGYNKGLDQARETDDLKSELNNVTLKVVQLEEQLQEERQKYFALECELEQAHEGNARLKNQIIALETDVEKRDARLQQAYLDVDRKTEQLNAVTHKVNKKEKTKVDQLIEKEKKISELEAKIGDLERRLQAGGVSPISGSRKSSGDLTSSSKDGSVRQRLRRGDEKGLSKQLQDAHSKLVQLEEQAQTMQTRLHEAQLTCDNKDSDITRLQEEYHKACVTIQALLKKNKLREKEFIVLQSEIEKKEKLIQEMSLPFKSFPTSENCENGDKSNEGLRKQLELAQEKIAEYARERNSSSEMEMQMQNLKKSLQEKEIRLKELEEKVNSVSMLEFKDNRTAELESKLEEMKIRLQSIQHENKYEEAENGKADCLKDDKLLIELETKKKEIENLKSELKKRTFNLQELVNKELWDKNREIEKLNKLCERRHLEIIQLKQQISSNDAQVSYAHDKLKESGNFNNVMRDVQIMNFEEIKENCSPLVFASEDKKTLQDQLLHCWEEKRFLIRKVEEVEGRLQNMPERDSDSRLVQTLKSDLNRARLDVEAAEKSRKEVVGACSLLTNRLQELADFLDSLLPSLGAKKRRVVQHAVERSRELSKSFSAAADDNSSWQNLQPSLYAPLLPDFSTVDFWSGDDITDLTLEEEANEEVETITRLRSKVELLEQELKQKDVELSKIHSQFTPTFQSMWSLGTNEFESLGAESNNLAKLVSMFENLEANENIGGIIENKTNDASLDSFMTGKNNVLVRNELKSSNIGEIVITSKKISSKEDKTCHNIGSESEAWSEPDRSVSLARIGLKDDTTAHSWVHDDSSDTTDNGQKNSLGGKRTKYDASELRRLQTKIRNLEETNEALRGELSILHKLAPPGLNATEDKSTSIEGFTEAMPVPPNVLEEIRNQREKLESAIFYNDNIRRQLEAIFASLKIQDKDCLSVQISKDDLTKIKDRCTELENQCKALESQCNDLEVALHTERSMCNTKEEQSDKLEQEFTLLKEEQTMWKKRTESLQCKINELENELKLKCNEVLEKQNSLFECRSDAQKQCDDFERKMKETENLLKEERNRWLRTETEIQSRLNALQIEYDELKVKLKNCDEEKKEISIRLECLTLEDEKCKKQLNDLYNRLEECKIREEKLYAGIEEWKLKCENCQKDAEDAKVRLQDAEKKMLEMEKINSELEMGLRGQVEAASRQCSQAEYKMKDLEMKHKQREAEWRSRILEVERGQNERVAEWRRQLDAATLTTSEMVLERTRLANDKLRLQQEIRRRDTSQLERVKSELERRVAELEAANSELEIRLTVLQVNKLPSDSETEDQDNILHSRSTKQLKWPSTSSSPPLSPSSKPVSPHLPVSPRYASQKSNDISSDYMSDQDNGQTCSVFWPQRTPVSASPDLGIESDQGRLSSLETNSHPRTVSIRIDDGVNELAKLKEENVYLHKHLMRTRQALENTLTQLTAANHKKRQVERAICKQLGKTHLILQKARVNLETDVDGC